MGYYAPHELTDAERIAVLEEHARQEMRWRVRMDKWRDSISREVTTIHVKVALFSVIGSLLGSAIVAVVVYVVLHGSASAPSTTHIP